MKQRVLYVCDVLFDARAGGLVAARRLVEALGPLDEVRTLGVGGDIDLKPLRVPWFDRLISANGFTFARPDDGAIREALAWADVVHLQLPTWLGFRTLQLAAEQGVPVVAAHHVQPENILYQLGFASAAPLARWLNRRLVGWYFSRAQHVIFPTRFAQSELLRAGLRTPSTVVSNGVPAGFRPAPARPRGPWFELLSVGRHAPEKRHAVLVEAVLRMRHRDRVRLTLGGRGPLTEALRRQAAPLGDRARVGFLSDQALLEAYQQADLVVHPSEVELEGLAAAEAQACGTPVMVSDAPSNAALEMALDPRFVFRASDPVDLAARLDFWVEHRVALEATRGPHAALGAQRTVRASALAAANVYDAVVGPRGREPARAA